MTPSTSTSIRHSLRRAAARLLTPLAALALLISAAPALAAPVTRTFVFTASGFGAGAPVDPLKGSFTVTWDPAVDVNDQSSGITQNSFNLSYDGTLTFSHSASRDTLFIGAGTDGAQATNGNDFSVVIRAASTAPNLVDVYYKRDDGSGARFASIQQLIPAPTVTGATPNSGLPAGGTSVTITGTDLTDATAVTFGGTAATSFTVDSATQITATAPAHAAGAVNITVTTPSGTGTGTNLYTYGTPPTVSSVGPKSGPTAGGVTVVVTGSGFTGATAVSIGGTAASFLVDSDTSLRADPPRTRRAP